MRVSEPNWGYLLAIICLVFAVLASTVVVKDTQDYISARSSQYEIITDGDTTFVTSLKYQITRELEQTGIVDISFLTPRYALLYHESGAIILFDAYSFRYIVVLIGDVQGAIKDGWSKDSLIPTNTWLGV